MSDAKPCICGSDKLRFCYTTEHTAHRVTGRTSSMTHWVQCETCGKMGPTRDNRTEAIRAWDKKMTALASLAGQPTGWYRMQLADGSKISHWWDGEQICMYEGNREFTFPLEQFSHFVPLIVVVDSVPTEPVLYTAGTCEDCQRISQSLIEKGDHHGGKKWVCKDRDDCHLYQARHS